MEYTRLGRSGLKVSRVALGGMSFGDSSRGFTDWALDDDAAEPIFRQAVELGITFWDTANIYGFGTAEEIMGRAEREMFDLNAVVSGCAEGYRLACPVVEIRYRGMTRDV